MPKQPGTLRELSLTFFWMSVLCSFLCILAILAIQFLQFAIMSSFVQKDFHVSFSNTTRNLDIWEKNKGKWSKALNSSIFGEFSYARQKGILFQGARKIPIQLQSVSEEYFSAFPLSFREGYFDPSLPSIVISEEMAFELQTHIDDVLEFAFLKDEGLDTPPIIMNLLVTGILRDAPGSDPYLAIGPSSHFGNYLRSKTKIGILFQDMNDAMNWKQVAYDQSRMSMNDVFSRHYNLLYSFQWEKILLYFALFIILLVSCIIIYISFSIVFQSYRSQWALLKILGMERKILLGVFAYKTFYLVTLGFLFGLFLAICLFLVYFSLLHLPWGMLFSHIIKWKALYWVLLIQALLCIVSFVIPIYRYYNQSVMEELRIHD